jgi:adenylylsulfate kinase
MVIWLTGMSGSGKSTLTEILCYTFKQKGFSVNHLDGDAVRKINNTNDDFSKETILKNNYSIIQECIKSVEHYNFVVVSVISPYEETRQYARKLLKDRYFEIYVKCSVEELIQRDTKGLYRKALRGEIDNLIGFSKKLVYEEPRNSNLVIRSDQMNIENAGSWILSHLPINL